MLSETTVDSTDWPTIAVVAFVGCCIAAVCIVIGLGFAGRIAWFALLDWWQS